jgi:hypothetical protein
MLEQDLREMILGQHGRCDRPGNLKAGSSRIALMWVRVVGSVAEVDIRVNVRCRKRWRQKRAGITRSETVRRKGRGDRVRRRREHGRETGAGRMARRVIGARFGNVNGGRLAGKGHSDARHGSLLSSHDVEEKKLAWRLLVAQLKQR